MIARVVSDGNPFNTKVLISGEPLKEIKSVKFDIAVGSPGRVHLELLASDVDVTGEISLSWRGRKISTIIYADGGEEEF